MQWRNREVDGWMDEKMIIHEMTLKNNKFKPIT